MDLGYFGAPFVPEIDPECPVIALGHSFGAAWLLRFCAEKSIRPKAFIALNGFPRFTEAPDYAPASPLRLVERMRGRFVQDPRTVLADFHQRCGLTGAPSSKPDPARLTGQSGKTECAVLKPPPNLLPPGEEEIPTLHTITLARLAEGLEQLARWDLRPELRALDCPVLSLASENDRIVPPAMAAHAFEGAADLRMVWHPTAGHVLPIEAPAWCAQRIRSFLAAL